MIQKRLYNVSTTRSESKRAKIPGKTIINLSYNNCKQAISVLVSVELIKVWR